MTNDLEIRIGYRFEDRSLLERALTHRSWSARQSEPLEDYERLEYLGDALLGFLVAEWLWQDDADAREGVLTRRRQDVVRAETLAATAMELGLGEALRLSYGEEKSGGRQKPSLLADAFEAVLGAIYLDGGINAAKSFVERTLRAPLSATRGRDSARRDWKTMFQESIQRTLMEAPTYRIVKEEGPAHRKIFDVEVLVRGQPRGSGRGATRKEAEQQAAREALKDSPGHDNETERMDEH